MTPDLSQRLAAALDAIQALGPREIEGYLRALRTSDPELASRLDLLLTRPGAAAAAAPGPEQVSPPAEPPAGPDGHEPHEPGEPTVAVDARPTASFKPPGAAQARDARCPSAGPVLGRYRLLHVVGRGAFGEVWKAFDPVLNKHVAVKVSRPDRALDAALLDEARKAASLKHPGIVQVYDAGADADGWYIVSEFVDGQSLRDRMDAGRLAFDRIALIVKTVAGALHAAHLAGLVHRDVKPGNILLDGACNAYLTDFGLAAREEDLFAERSKVSGTLAYMPPEQICGDTHLLDGRADIYALGAVLYELLTGRPLFRAADIEEYRELILRREPRPPRAVAADVPEALERVCLKCLAKAVKDRYRTAQDVAAELDAWLAGSTRSAVTVAPPAARRWKPAAVAGGVLALAVAALVAVLTFDRWRPGTTPDRDTEPVVTVTPAKKVPTVKPLLWRPLPDENRWEVLTSPDRLAVFTHSTALLQLGETTAESWELSATIRQLAGKGRVGLFLGYRTDPKTATATYELVRLVTAGNETFLQRRIEKYNLAGPFADPEGVTHGSAPVAPAPEYAIRLVVRGNRLAEVWLNGVAVPELANPPVQLTAAGAYGTYNRGSDGVFSKLLFDDQPIPLLAEATTARPPENR